MHILKRAQRGFTLVELVIVIGIIGVVIAITTVSLTGVQSRGRDDRRRLDIEELQVALAQYHANQPGGFYPTTLDVLVTNRYIDTLPVDPSTKTSGAYGYIHLPGGCDNTAGNYCLNYQLSITLESGDVYEVGPGD